MLELPLLELLLALIDVVAVVEPVEPAVDPVVEVAAVLPEEEALVDEVAVEELPPEPVCPVPVEAEPDVVAETVEEPFGCDGVQADDRTARETNQVRKNRLPLRPPS